MSAILFLLTLLVAFVDASPRIVDVGMVAPDIIAVAMYEGAVELGTLQRYDAQPNDEIKVESPQRTSVRRNRREIGTLAGPEGRRMLRTPDRFSGERIDRQRLVDVESCSVSNGPAIRSVAFKTRVLDAANVEFGDWKAAFEFIVFLSLEQPLDEGSHTLRHADFEAFKFDRDDARTISPAVHVSAVGFRPSDPGKRATLTCWTGDGGAIDYLQRFPDLTFQVVEHQSGREMFSGQVTLRQEAEADDDHTGLWGRPNGMQFNRTGGPVCSMDLEKLTEPGTYRVVVDGVGSSMPFRIADDVYNDLWRLALRGLHVHRRNISVDVESVYGEKWVRPAADDSGAVVSTARFGNATFDAFVAGATDTPAPETRGGWMDAGDFDSNHNHYWASLLLLDLVDRHPRVLATTLWQTTTMVYLDGSTRRNGFGVLKHGWAPFGFGVGGCPQAGAHHVVLFPEVVPTDKSFPPHIKPDRDEYIAAGVTGLAFVLGHHPTNRPLVTGLETLSGVDDSWRSVHQILHLDSRYAGHRAPVGITDYAAVRPIRDNNSWPINWPLDRDQSVFPQYELWPEYENLHEFPLWGAMMEYTVWQTVAPTIWFAAELHARGRGVSRGTRK